MNDRLLMFVHIPKAAGMTLHRIIIRQYPKGSVFFLDGQRVAEDTQRYLTLSEGERGRYRSVVGHLPYGLHEFVPKPFDYITLLRDPVDRLISHYYYAKSTPGNRLYDWIKAENADVERYVQEKIPGNGQSRMLCGFTRSSPRRHEQPETDLLGIAKTNLKEHFIAFGLAERFDETMLVFQKKLGWNDVRYVTVNVTQARPDKEDVPEAARKAIERHSALDMELYAYAQDLYREQVRQAGIQAHDVEAYQRGNQSYQQMEAAKRKIKQGIKKILGRA